MLSTPILVHIYKKILFDHHYVDKMSVNPATYYIKIYMNINVRVLVINKKKLIKIIVG